MKRMKRIFLLVCLILPVHAFAQDAPKPAASPEPVSPAAPVVEKSAKPKPVILEKEKLTELTLLRLQMENAQLKADAACFAPEQKLRIGKGHAVGIGQQGVAVVGVGVQFFPGIGQTAFIELGVRFHGGTPCFLWGCQRVGSTAQRSGG